jgi:nicotinate-nucleotide pyrophosphorylase (carboxylating)
LLDNFSPPRLRKLVRDIRKINANVILEASGGVNLKTVRAIGCSGVDRISVGAITHSVSASDFSLKL